MDNQPENLPAVDPEAAHLDSFRAPDLGFEDTPDDDVQRPDDEGVFEAEKEPPAELMDTDAFWVVFSIAFGAPAIFIPDLKPLEIQPEEVPAARAASDAAHALLSIYYPKALLPFNETMAHLIVLGPFLITKAMIVKAVLEARNRPEPQEPKDVTPQHDGEEPAFQSSRQPAPDTGPTSWMDAEVPA